MYKSPMKLFSCKGDTAMKDFLVIFFASGLVIAVSMLCYKIWFDWIVGLDAPGWFKFMLIA